MSGNSKVLTKDNLSALLKELAKQYRKLSGKKMPAEIILVGGAAVLARYGFRDMTTDIDAIIQASSAMRDTAIRVADSFGLPEDWLNSDFLHTDSATGKLLQFSEYYAISSNIVTIRVVTAEYLIAMKLRAGRRYKSDLSDIIGIMAEHQTKGAPITYEMVRKAVNDLYGSWDVLPDTSKRFFEQLCKAEDPSEMYQKTRSMEQYAGDKLRTLDRDYPGLVGTDSIQNILDRITKGHTIFEDEATKNP